MPTATATTELVKAIERVLLDAGTRITTGVIVDRVAERLTPGIPPVKRREDNPNALIYDTVTKELAYMTGQDRRSGGENHPHFRRWIVRTTVGGIGSTWRSPNWTFCSGTLTPSRTTSPGLAAGTAARAAGGRRTQPLGSSCPSSSRRSSRSAPGAGPMNAGPLIWKSTTSSLGWRAGRRSWVIFRPCARHAISRRAPDPRPSCGSG